MAVNLVLLLAFSFIAFSVGAPNCANPCADLWAAKDCNKVQYCIKNDWSRIRPTGKRDDVCDICLRLVQEARTTLESKEMQDELKQVFEGSCKLLMLKPAVELCDKMVDEMVPELVAVLSSQMDPETVCSVAKLCNNDLLRDLQKNSKRCTECEKFMAASREKMKSVSEEEFKEELVQLCRSTGSFSDACYYAGSVYSSLLYNQTRMGLEGSPCEATLVCPSGSGEAAEGMGGLCPSRLTKRMCPLCLGVARNVIAQLTRVKSMEDYEKNFFKICTNLRFPGDFCSQSAKNVRMYNFLKENGESVSRSFCSKTVCAERRLEDVPIWPLVPVQGFPPSIEEVEDVVLKILVDFIREDGERELPLDAEEEEEGPCEQSPVEKVPTPIDCQTCQLTLKKVSQVLAEEENKDAIKGSVDAMCSRLPRRTKEKCLSIGESHEKEVREVVLQQSSSDAACVRMGYCSQPKGEDSSLRSISYGDPLDNPTFFAPALLSPFYESDCKMCKQLSQVLSNYVSANNSNINLDVACLMSKNIRECLGFLRSYSPDISQAFADYVSSEKICNVLPLCESKETYVAPKRKSMNLCRACRTWVEGVTSILLDEKNMEMIKATFELVCNKLGEERREKCREAVKERSAEMLANVLKLLSPDEACRNLNYCPREDNESEPTSSLAAKASPEESSELDKVPCKFCLIAVKTLMDELEDNRTEEAIRKVLKTVCDYFPEETKDTCRNLIDQYSEGLIDMIIADFSPSEICIHLKLCELTNSLIGIDRPLSLPTFDIGTNEIRDEEWEPLRTSEAAREWGGDGARLLERVHSAVEECALCEALVQVISSHKKMLVKDYDFAGNSSTICRIVPRHKRKQCMSMLVSYGPSIVNLIVDKRVDPNNVCLELTLCDSSMHAKVDMPVSLPEPVMAPAKNECLQGPGFWCSSEENARKCGTYLHCREVVWKREEKV